MAAQQRPPAFRGRSREREALDRLLDAARGGRSSVLVIRGEAGVGKTALMRHAADRASGFRVVQIAGVESEMELPFAGCISSACRCSIASERSRNRSRTPCASRSAWPPAPRQSASSWVWRR
jgi:hypothetical protein